MHVGVGRESGRSVQGDRVRLCRLFAVDIVGQVLGVVEGRLASVVDAGPVAEVGELVHVEPHAREGHLASEVVKDE